MLLLDNSIATTGAYRSALAMAASLQAEVETIFVLPKSSALLSEVISLGHRCHALPMVEIGRSVKRVVTYLPALIANGFRLRRLLAKEHIDVLVANDYYNLLPLVVRALGWRGRIVSVVRLLPKGQRTLLNLLWIAAMRFAANRVVAVSEAVKAQLPDHMNVEVVYFPVGRGLEALPFQSAPALHSNDSVRFLYLANYIPGKGQTYALRAFVKVSKQCPKARLRFVGSDMGLLKNKAYKQSLVNEAIHLSMRDCIDFAGAANDIVAEIRACDVLLNFSDSESFSHTCVEAALLGRPVVATRCGGPAEILEDGITGLLVPCAGVEQMTDAMLRLTWDFRERDSMGRRAREKLTCMLDPDAFRAKMATILGIPLC